MSKCHFEFFSSGIALLGPTYPFLGWVGGALEVLKRFTQINHPKIEKDMIETVKFYQKQWMYP